MKIAVAQINPIVAAFDHNLEQMTECINRAKQQNCDLVVFSELVVSGYPPRDLLERPDFIDANLRALNQLVSTTAGIGVICGYIERNPLESGKPLHNAAVLFENGQVMQTVYKRLLPTYDVFDERRFFEPGSAAQALDYKGRRVGLTICEDVWNDKDIFGKRIYPCDPVQELISDGTDLIVNISASPFQRDKRDLRRRILSNIASKHKVTVVFANQVGGNDGIIFDGLSAVFNPDGELAARARDFETDLLTFDTARPKPSPDNLHPNSGTEQEAVLKALVTGTRDYLTTCGFSKAIVGLSGGIDSALTVWIAVAALGPENVSTVFMPSAYTSRDNEEDTAALATNLGIPRDVIPIEEMYQAFLKHLSTPADAADPGITEQNIQARIRGTILMGLSNRTGALVLSTGNKSELAVGYCTLYGDMNGGLAVISDVPKTLVYDLARLINREKEVIPQRIITKAPSAELKPDQTDQDDLPPYEIIDPILKGYIEEYRDLDELTAMGFERRLVEEVIARVERNEYKRHQAAPGLKITAKAFGEGRRYPIARGLGDYARFAAG